MIKLFSFMRRNPALTSEEFRAYWVDVHAPLVREKLPTLRSYKGYLPTGVDDDFGADGIVELGFDSIDAMRQAMDSPAFNTPDRIASSSKLLDERDIRRFVVEQVDFLAG